MTHAQWVIFWLVIMGAYALWALGALARETWAKQAPVNPPHPLPFWSATFTQEDE